MKSAIEFHHEQAVMLRKISETNPGPAETYAPLARLIGQRIARLEMLRHADRYYDVSRKLFQEFNSRAAETGDKKLKRQARSGGLLHGFNIITKLLSYTPRAYSDFVSARGTNVSIE